MGSEMGEGNFDSTVSFQVNIHSPSALEEEMNELPRKKKFSCSTTCPFSKQDYSESDAAQRSKTSIKLSWLLVVYTIVMVIEIIGGLKAHSLAIFTDALHLLSDIAGFSISLFTVWVSGWEATSHHSFGFNRLEVLGALLSVLLIWIVSGNLIYEAIKRLITEQTKVNGKLMFATAAFGFLINLVLVLWLGHDHSSHHGHSHHDHAHDNHSHHDHARDGHPHHHHEEEEESHREDQENTNLMLTPHGKTQFLNINIQGAYLHLVTDLIQSAGVMIAGSVIWVKPKWLLVDLVCTLVFSIVALGTTLPMWKNIFNVLMEEAPSGIDAARIEEGLKLIRGVCDVHDLHVWAISVGKHVLSCHIVIGPEVGSDEILCEVREYCEETYGIHHVTIQIEQEL